MIKQCFILLMGVVCLVQTASAQSNSDYKYVDNSAHLDSLLKDKFNPNEPGFVFKVIKDGRVIKQGAFGVSDTEVGGPIGFDTPFYIASLGKTFTSAAILILMQDGDLKLTDKLSKYFQGFEHFGDLVSIEQLMNHTSGLADHFDEFGEDVDHLDNAMVISFLKRKSLLFEPGTDYAYSNSAYVLLAEIVQQVSGKSFTDFLSERIFGPLGMKHTVVVERPGQKIPDRAKGYSLTDEGYQLNDYEGIYTLGAGGIYSTINDLVKWDQALYSERILTEASKRLAFTKASVPGKRTYLAMGWMDESFGPKTPDFTGLSYVMSFGSLKGFRGRLMRFTDFGLSIITLSNSGNAHLWGENFARAYFRKKQR